MAAIEDHPLRLARIRAGLTAEALGELVGVSRATVNAIEQGRLRKPRPEVFEVLAKRNAMKPERLRGFYNAWLDERDEHVAGVDDRINSELTAKARAVLALDPAVVGRYGSFTAWRKDIFPSAAGFASLLMVSATTLRRLENGDISMPKPIIKALTKRLNLSDEYVAVLMQLEGKDPDDAVREHWRRAKRIQRERPRLEASEGEVGANDD